MSTKTKLILDLSMFGAFLAVANPHLTGNTIHEWLGVSLAAAVITHLLLNWNWIINVGKEFFKKIWHQSRLNFVVNALFFIAMTGSLFTGLLISKSVMSTLGITLDVSQGWKSIHSLLSDASVMVLGIHLALHLKWITANIGRYIVNPVRGLFERRAVRQPLMPQVVRLERNK
jgi:hypothetical protein